MLTPQQRAGIEEYYASKSVGKTARERYEHFRDTQELSHSIYYNINYDEGAEADTSRLALLEFALCGWNGEI